MGNPSSVAQPRDTEQQLDKNRKSLQLSESFYLLPTNVMSTVSDKQTNKHLALLNMSWKKVEEPKLEELSEREMEAVTTVFRSFETGLREATIYPKDLLPAMKMLGLNPMEQEIVDLKNSIARNGVIYFPEFCSSTQALSQLS